MSIITAMAQMFSFRERHQHTRLQSHDEVEEEGAAAERSTDVSFGAAEADDADADPILVETVSDEEEARLDDRVEEDDGIVDIDMLTPRLPRRATVSLAELEEERELARRRTSACVLLAVFVLFRLWVEALQNGDMVLLLLCLVGTSWTARWIRYNRDREEELDRRIAAYLDSSDPGTTEVDRNDLRMLSFQAQLALAIMDSQRQMMQGGFGHPDGHHGGVGLSDAAKQRWERFNFKTNPVGGKGGSSGREKSAGIEKEGKIVDEELPQCSICLCEYEEGEQLVKLPCGHIYHEDCVSSWTTHSIRCPLCNCDLESMPETLDTQVQQGELNQV